jgi:hypothetical protein
LLSKPLLFDFSILIPFCELWVVRLPFNRLPCELLSQIPSVVLTLASFPAMLLLFEEANQRP